MNQHVVDKKILVTSQPKNGTHLLLRALHLIPDLELAQPDEINWAKRDQIFEPLSTLRPGEFIKTHLIWSGKVDKFIRENNFVVFNMIRDPRDNIVSYMHFLKKLENHRLHKAFMEFPDDNARIMALIEGFNKTIDGEKCKVNSIDTPLMNWWRWNEHDYCMPVKFENLIGSKGGGNDDLQKREIIKILDHIGIEAKPSLVKHIQENIFGANTLSFRKGMIGDWKNYFTDEHKRAFKDRANLALVHYGYEQDDRW